MLEEIGFLVSKSIGKLLKMTENIVLEYPNNPKSLTLYGSFMADFYHDKDKGNELLSQAENIKLAN